jgi:ABC-type transporter Mla subunit MlaD
MSKTFQRRYDCGRSRRRIKDLTNGLTSVIAQLEKQKTAIERALAALRDVEGTAAAAAPASTERTPRKASNKRSLAQKARWAAKKAAEAVPAAAPLQPARKGGMTPEGRQRLAEAMKRRWAVKRAASAVKKAGRKKKAA